MSSNPNDDRKYMKMCLALARRAEGRTAPNPMVGSVVVDSNDQIIGDGHHVAAGQAHAEVVALGRAGAAAKGGTLYVNLEPCCHHGKTPPCTDTVIKSGVKRVVIGMVDPNPRVAGGGVKLLEENGITVTSGILEDEARWLNRGFISRVTTGRPWVCLKLASTLDGKIADRFGKSRYISGPEARAHVHELRNHYDAVLIGGRTAQLDDPELNVRDISGSRDPIRVIMESRVPSSVKLKVHDESSGGRTIIVCTKKYAESKPASLPDHVKLIPVDNPTLDQIDLKLALSALGEEGINTILCEGGGRLAGALLSDGLVDEVQWIIAAKIMGDAEAISSVLTSVAVPMDQITALKNVRVTALGSDVLVTGLL